MNTLAEQTLEKLMSCPYYDENCKECPFEALRKLKMSDRITIHRGLTCDEHKRFVAKHNQLFTTRFQDEARQFLHQN